MSTGDTPPRRNDAHLEPVVVAAGTVGLITTLARIVAGLTTDKALTLFVCMGFGYLLYISLKSASDDKAAQIRSAEDARERDRLFYTAQRDADRQHCDEREDKRRRDKQLDDDRLRTFFATEMDKHRGAMMEISTRIMRIEAAIIKPPGP